MLRIFTSALGCTSKIQYYGEFLHYRKRIESDLGCKIGKGKMKEFLQFVIFLPFLLPPIISGLALLIFFREVGLPRSLNTVVIGHTIFVLAIVYRIILNKLETLKPSLMESAYDLGANKFQAFWYVLLPNIRLSLIIAGLLAFTISLDETLITLFLIGDDTTWPIKLWAKMRVGFSKQVNASVTLILILTTTNLPGSGLRQGDVPLCWARPVAGPPWVTMVVIREKRKENKRTLAT